MLHYKHNGGHMQYTVLIPGGFKPPHKGHYDYIKFYLDNPDVKEVRLYIGSKARDEISLDTTEEVLRLYGLLDHPKMTFQRAMVREGKSGPYTNPLLDCYEYAETRIDEPMGLACSSKDKNYQERFNAYFKDMDDCLAARAQVINQPDVTASCIITHQKPDNSAAMMKMFSEVLSKVATAQEQAQQ